MRLFSIASDFTKSFHHAWLFTLESKDANGPEYLHRKRLTFGENFVCAGGVWMSGYETVKENLIQPQARAFKLAPSELDQEHLPRKADDGSLTFLLALSQKGAGGDGRWEAYRSAFEDYVSETEETMLRNNGDETTKKLFDKLQEDYQKSEKTRGCAFFTDNDTGLQDFLLRYLHYVLLGLDPTDDAEMEELNHLHYDRLSAAYFLKVCSCSCYCLWCFWYPEFSNESCSRTTIAYRKCAPMHQIQGLGRTI